MKQIVLCFAGAQAMKSLDLCGMNPSWLPGDFFLRPRGDLPVAPSKASLNPVSRENQFRKLPNSPCQWKQPPKIAPGKANIASLWKKSLYRSWRKERLEVFHLAASRQASLLATHPAGRPAAWHTSRTSGHPADKQAGCPAIKLLRKLSSLLDWLEAC